MVEGISLEYERVVYRRRGRGSKEERGREGRKEAREESALYLSLEIGLGVAGMDSMELEVAG